MNRIIYNVVFGTRYYYMGLWEIGVLDILVYVP
jgi:hypothetical protein